MCGGGEEHVCVRMIAASASATAAVRLQGVSSSTRGSSQGHCNKNCGILTCLSAVAFVAVPSSATAPGQSVRGVALLVAACGACRQPPVSKLHLRLPRCLPLSQSGHGRGACSSAAREALAKRKHCLALLQPMSHSVPSRLLAVTCPPPQAAHPAKTEQGPMQLAPSLHLCCHPPLLEG